MTPTARRPARRRPSAAAPDAPAAPAESYPISGVDRAHPALGLGLWGLGRWKAEDERRTREALVRAIELGFRWFDTAEVYGAGRSERLLGDVLHRADPPPSDAYVVTKVSWEHLRPAQIRAALINSLERLGRRSVELYLVHAPDPRVPLAETMATLEGLRIDGKIGAIGVSNFSVEQLEEAQRHLGSTPLAVHQMRYSLLERPDAEEVVEYCRDHDILVEAYTPLARGILAGRYLDGTSVPPEVRRFAQDLFGESTLAEVLARARRLRALALEANVPLASIALRWLAARGIAPIVGTSRSAHVDELLRAWSVRPPAELLERAERIARGTGA